MSVCLLKNNCWTGLCDPDRSLWFRHLRWVWRVKKKIHKKKKSAFKERLKKSLQLLKCLLILLFIFFPLLCRTRSSHYFQFFFRVWWFWSLQESSAALSAIMSVFKFSVRCCGFGFHWAPQSKRVRRSVRPQTARRSLLSPKQSRLKAESSTLKEL